MFPEGEIDGVLLGAIIMNDANLAAIERGLHRLTYSGATSRNAELDRAAKGDKRAKIGQLLSKVQARSRAERAQSEPTHDHRVAKMWRELRSGDRNEMAGHELARLIEIRRAIDGTDPSRS